MKIKGIGFENIEKRLPGINAYRLIDMIETVIVNNFHEFMLGGNKMFRINRVKGLYEHNVTITFDDMHCNVNYLSNDADGKRYKNEVFVIHYSDIEFSDSEKVKIVDLFMHEKIAKEMTVNE